MKEVQATFGSGMIDDPMLIPAMPTLTVTGSEGRGPCSEVTHCQMVSNAGQRNRQVIYLPSAGPFSGKHKQV